ncbi:hypothetical protein B9Z55_011277 [Caenorhabditis nigoni]|nr:hypothetical protein B9Z55_011277 [Caenorhabditis nigoni]
MTNQNSNQTQRRLANHLCLNILKAMKYHAIIAYSFVSKKALSLFQSLRLPISSILIEMKEDPVIRLDFGTKCIVLEFKMGKNNEHVTCLNDFPVNLDFQSLRNAFPKLRKISVHGSRNEISEHEILNAQNVLRAFLPYLKEVQLFHVPLGENLTCQHIGMANLELLNFFYPKNFNFDCLFTLNVQMCMIETDHMPLRDLNRFFKLWIKGSNPRLEVLSISCDTETVPDSSVLLKGLKVKELEKVEEEESEIEYEDEDEEEQSDAVSERSESEWESEESESEKSESESEAESGEELDDEEIEGGEEKKFFIMNCHGMSGQIEFKRFEVNFIVSKINWG